MDDPLLSFGEWLRRRRKALDLTQEALANLVGCSKDLIVKIEGGARRPSREIAVLLATHLQLLPAEHAGFIRAARVELPVDRLPPPAQSVPRPTLLPAPPQEPPMPRHNLPVRLDAFLGRARETAELTALLRQPTLRLLTLTGPGGVGKTRLALHTAELLLPKYPDGVWFVDLAPISDPEQVALAVMQALGLREVPDQAPEARLLHWLRTKRLLLLLDNFEQVLDAATLVAALLRGARELRVLVTSRAPLRLTGEQEYPVGALELPPPTSDPLSSVAALTQYDGVRLFIARAQAVRPEFQVTNANAPAVAEICYRLDGLPLAIELAAARIRMFAPEALLVQLQQSLLPMLSGGARDLPARQQTITATIAWSYRLLTSEQQRLFARLGVFVGGWTLEAAKVVGAEDGVDVVSELQALIEHSLVQESEPEQGLRYTMLETVQAFALEQHRLDAQATKIYHRHAEFFAALAAHVEPLIWTDQQNQAFSHLNHEIGNLRAA